MSTDVLYQVHLGAEYCCKRGVRYRELSSVEVRELENRAAVTCGKDATNMQVRNEVLRLGVRAMIEQMTEPVKTLEGLAPEAWTTLTVQMKETQGPWCLDRLFGAKDEALLGARYTAHHEIRTSEVEALEGKVLEVQRA